VPVYVDSMEAPFGGMVMCHMWADSDAELLAMVDRIGVQRKWIQGHPELSFGKHRNASWIHFDIAKSKRALAVKAGAIETDRFGPLEHTALLKLKHENIEIRQVGLRQLRAVWKARGEPNLV
jgi:Protein of unknown function (DUF4031)